MDIHEMAKKMVCKLGLHKFEDVPGKPVEGWWEPIVTHQICIKCGKVEKIPTLEWDGTDGY